MVPDRTGCGKCCFAFVVLSLLTGRDGVIIQHPQNAASDVNGSVIFNCSTDASYTIEAWTFSKNGSQLPGQFDYITNDKCEVQPSFAHNYRSELAGAKNESCNLIIVNIHKDLGGVHTCLDSALYRGVSVALLTVVDSASQHIAVHPTSDCDTAETIDLSCGIDYSGSVSPAPLLPPSVNLTSDSINELINSTEIVSSNRVTRYVTFAVSSPGSVGPFHCVAYFGKPQNLPNPVPPVMYIDNAPGNEYNTDMSAISLPNFIPASNVQILGQGCLDGLCKCADGVSIVLECVADGCPHPNISWSIIGNSSALDVEGNKFNVTFSGSFQCTATNTFNDSSSFKATANVTVSGCGPAKPPGPDPTMAIAIAVPVAYCGSCVLISVIFLIFYGLSKEYRNQLNDTCPRLKDMLPTMNDNSCSCWVILTVFIAVLGAIFCIPALLIATCCGSKEKKPQGKKKKKTEESGMESPTNNSHNNSPPTNRQQGDPCQLELQSQDSYHPSRQPTPLGKGTPVNPDGIQYSELPLPIDQRAGSRKPIQFIDGQEGAYADLWST